MLTSGIGIGAKGNAAETLLPLMLRGHYPCGKYDLGLFFTHVTSVGCDWVLLPSQLLCMLGEVAEEGPK